MEKRSFRIGLISILILLSMISILNINNVKYNQKSLPELRMNQANEWTQTAFPNSWRGIDISETGQYIIASAFTGCWLSSDYGQTWLKVRNGQYFDVSISKNGSIILCARLGQYIYVSYDYGQSWSSKTGRVQHYGSDISGTGKYMFIVPNNVRIRRSINFGQTFSYVDVSNLWYDVICSNTGQYVSATKRTPSGHIRVSSNYGASFSTKTSGYDFRHIDMSDSGQYQIACSYNGRIHISNDYGNTWNIYSNISKWSSVCCSGNGSYALSCKQNGYMYESSDYGANWNIEFNENKNWFDVNMNTNATMLVATVINGYIWIKDLRPVDIITFPIFLRNTYSLMTYIIMFFLIGVLLLCFSKFKSYILTLIVFLFSLIIGIVSMNESIIPFTPYFQLFFIFFQFLIFMVITLQTFNKNKRY